MSIHPLPQFENDLAEYLQEQEDREAYEKLNAPSTIVVRFGHLRMVGEFPYSGDAKPGCGSKLVVQTHRGVELGEMLTSTCRNSGCSKSVSRKEMLEYIENSGGKQYPFYDRGQVLRIATVDDLNEQTKIEQRKNELRMIAKGMVEEMGLAMKIIEAEPLLGGERVVFYFGSDDRVDFRDLVSQLQQRVGTKVELRQIGARDEARITADYERCGQYCCCKSFLKVLKPVSMKSAKIQKATLDPLKISGRCGRLMCCLRYEDETYDQLRKNLPNRKSRVGTPEGDGIVLNTQILTQLALIKLDSGTEVAIPVEDLTEPDSKVAPEPGARVTRPKRESRDRGSSVKAPTKKRRPRSDDSESDGARSNDSVESDSNTPETGDRPKKKRRRRRRSGSGGSGESGTGAGTGTGTGSGSAEAQGSESSSQGGPESSRSDNQGDSGAGAGDSGPKKKRKRRRRRRPSGEGGADSGSGGGSGGGSPNDG